MSSMSWQQVKLGAGGQVIDQDIAPDGTFVVCTDTNGAYLWSGSRWNSIVTRSSLPSIDANNVFRGGSCWAAAIAYSQTSRLYMLYQGSAYRSDNSGASWIKLTNFPTDGLADKNQTTAARLYGKKLIIDPNNPDKIYASHTSAGVYVSTDAGATFTQVSAITAGSTSDGAGNYPGHAGMVFDPTGGVDGSGNTKNIVIPSWGNGVWRSTDAGATWTQIANGTSSPSKVTDGKVGLRLADSVGIYWCVDKVSGTWKYVGGSWTQVDSNGLTSVAPWPVYGNTSKPWAFTGGHTAPGRVAIFQGSGNAFRQTLDDGATWIQFAPGTDTWNTNFPTGSGPSVATDIPWLAWSGANDANFKKMGIAGIHPTTGNAYITDGIGVWFATLPTTFVSIGNWTSQSLGIEQLVPNCGVSPAGGNVILGCSDRPIWPNPGTSSFPSTYEPNNSLGTTDTLNDCRALEVCENFPLKIVALCNTIPTGGYGDRSGYTTNGGTTWTSFTAFPTGNATSFRGGDLAVNCNDIDNVVWCVGDNGEMWVTATATGTPAWTKIAAGFPAGMIPTTGTIGWVDNATLHRKIVWANPITAGTFYAYNWMAPKAVAGGTNDGVLLKSTNKGVTWTKVFGGTVAVGTGNNFHAKFKMPWTSATDMFYTDGPQGSDGDPQPALFTDFKRSQDAGVTWSSILSQAEISDFSFGKPRNPGGYPALYVWGWVAGGFGLFLSENAGDSVPTWQNLGQYPLPASIQQDVRVVLADRNTFGLVYLGMAPGGGFVVGTLDIATNVFSFSVVHGHARRETKMIGY